MPDTKCPTCTRTLTCVLGGDAYAGSPAVHQCYDCGTVVVEHPHPPVDAYVPRWARSHLALLAELEATAAWLEERAGVLDSLTAAKKTHPGRALAVEAARLRGRAVLLRQAVLDAKGA